MSFKDEYLQAVSTDCWVSLYQRIINRTKSYPAKEYLKPKNKPLNRYRDVFPYDHSRVKLDHPSTDYINANLVQVPRANRNYILTQGPLPNTVSHFWLMVWQQNSAAIIMLNNIIEKNEVKSEYYWPKQNGHEHAVRLKDVDLIVELISEENFSFFTVRLLRIHNTASLQSREAVHYHYTTWPDFGVPSSPKEFLDFLRCVRESGVLTHLYGPPVIHCSAGIGRSGTFCLVDTCSVIMEREGLEGIDVADILVGLRRDRMGLIQTAEQLRFSYEAILMASQNLDRNRSPMDFFLRNSTPRTSADVGTSESNIFETPPPVPPRTGSCMEAPRKPLPRIPNRHSLGGVPSVLNLPNVSPISNEEILDSDDESPEMVIHEEINAHNNGNSSNIIRRRDIPESPSMEEDQPSEDRERERNNEGGGKTCWGYLKAKPITFTVCVVLTGIAVYKYIKR